MSIIFDNGGILVEHESELPDLQGVELFLDLETTSLDKKIRSLNPWHHCHVLGIAVCVDSSKSYYVPVNHAHGKNIKASVVQQWVSHLVDNTSRWINHNVKYDSQVLAVDFGVETPNPVYCTLDLARLIDSDRLHYSLDSLCKDWLKQDIKQYEMRLKPYLLKNADYGMIPIDVLGEYACQDVLSNRQLWKYIKVNVPEESKKLVETSSQVTACLTRIERTGVRINPSQVAAAELKALIEMSEAQEKIHGILGYSIEPHNNAECFDTLCNNLGFPVLAYNDSGNPSFDKHALAAYKSLPGAPIELLNLMLKFRKWHTFTGLFTKPFRALHKEGLLHSSYKQTVRTGRMACTLPNMQQCMAEAKEMIVPGEDEVIITSDYSQIEFRVIVHYIKDDACIKAYLDDPFTDFHTWVATMCDIHRKPAKTVNFLMGYGGGQGKLVEQLTHIPELVGGILEALNRDMTIHAEKKAELFSMLAKQRGVEVYNKYHETLPGLKITSRQAMNRVYERGFCVNKYGRRRTLPAQFAYRAFNTICQGTAADLMKERLVALELWLMTNYPGVNLIGVVHDEVILRAPKQAVTPELLDSISYILEDIQTELRIPIRTTVGVSDVSWRAASESAAPRLFDRKTFRLVA